MEVWAMSPKYIVNLLLVIAGGFLAVASRGFASSTAGWIAVGIGILAVVLAAAGLAMMRLQPRAIGYGLTAAVGIWTIVSSLVFTGTALGWLVLADALGLAAIAIVELVVHEFSTERVVHTLVVSDSDRLQHAA
jgi:hypothetical protein